MLGRRRNRDEGPGYAQNAPVRAKRGTASTWLVLALSAAMPPPLARAEDLSLGSYLLRGSAHVQVAPFPTRDDPGEMKVTVGRTDTPRLLSVRLESHGYTCTLLASRSPGGVLEFSTPARCASDVREPDARGHVDARLRSGRGTLRGGRLTLELAFEIRGSVATPIPRTTFRLLDTEFTVPEGWTPGVPLGGSVALSGSGARQGS
jgi:hypothetical protein